MQSLQFGDYSISKLFVPRRRAEDSAGARRGEADKGTGNLEMELLIFRQAAAR
jgi:hypothetical protein